MKLTCIELSNWLAHRHVTLPINPMTIICGPNFAGKSSIADAIAFGMLGDTRRVHAKGERKMLLSDGATKGAVTLSFGDKALIRDISTGKLTQGLAMGGADVCFDALPFLTDPGLFTRVDADQRRQILQAVLRAEPDKNKVAGEMERRGVRPDVVKQLRAAHLGGMESWIDMAKQSAADGRAAWKRLTGEAYGAKKAADWTCPIPERPSDVEIAAAAQAVADAQSAWQAAERAVGGSAAEKGGSFGHSATLKRMRDQLAELPALEAQTRGIIAAEEQAHDQHATKKEAYEAMMLRKRDEAPCPHCGGLVHIDQNGRLHQSTGAVAKPLDWQIEAAKGELDHLSGAAAAASTARRAHEAKITQLHVLKDSLADVEKEAANAGPEPSEASLEAARTAQAAVKQAQEAQEAVAARVRSADEAVDRSAKAKKAHEAVEQWTKVSELIAPDGIPGEILIAAMEPMESALRAVATETGWRQVAVGADMNVTANGRPYDLLSESEKWRADAALTVTLARLSGLRLVVLDRFDVLDVPSRSPTMGWLFKQMQAGFLETCLLIGTMKEAPKAPPAVKVHWLASSHNQEVAA